MFRIGKFQPYAGRVIYFCISSDGVVGHGFEGDAGLLLALREGGHLETVLDSPELQVVDFGIEIDTLMPDGMLFLSAADGTTVIWFPGRGLFDRSFGSVHAAVMSPPSLDDIDEAFDPAVQRF